MSKSYVRFKRWSSKNWKLSIRSINKRSRDITYSHTHLWNRILKIVPYHLEKSWALHVCIVILICGFHQLRVKQRLIYKLVNCIGIKEWCINAGEIALTSTARAMEGHHYYWCMYLHKECFDALVQFQFQNVKS